MPVSFPGRSLIPDPGDHDPLADAPSPLAPGAAHGVDRLAGGEGNMADPGVRVRVGGGATLPGGVPRGGAAEVARAANGAGGAAAIDLSVTRATPGRGPAADRGTVTASVRGAAVAGVATSGVDRMLGVMDQGAKVQRSAERLYDDVRGLVRSIEGSRDVARLKQLAAAAGTRRLTVAEMAEANKLAGDVEQQLRRASQVLGQAGPVLDEIVGLVGGLGGGALSASAGAAGGAYMEERLGLRTPAVRFGAHRLDASLGVHLVQPGVVPQEVRARAAEIDEAIALRSSMVAVRAYVDVTARGLAELKGSLDSVRGDLATLRGTADAGADRLAAVRSNPIGALAEADRLAADAGKLAGDLSTQGDALGKRAESLVKSVDVKVDAGLEIAQPTGSLGAGLDDASVRWRYDPDQSFQLAVRAYVENAAGVLPGRRDRFSLDPAAVAARALGGSGGSGAAGALTPVSSARANVYGDFFPRTFGADVGVSMNRDTSARTDVLAGVATDGKRVSAHLGVVQQIGRRVLVRLGLVDPDVARRADHTLIPTAGVDLRLGPRADPGRVTLGLDGGAAVNLGGPGRDPGVSGGQGGLGLTIHF